ncbi:34308_t:CDS:2, partial [Gigaspora margarita]
FDNLELCFDSNNSLECCFDNNDNRDFFDKILDNNSQLIINNEEDNGLSDCEVNDLTNKNEDLYPLNKGHLLKIGTKLRGVNSEHAISIRNGQGFGAFEHEVRVDFSYIDSIRGQYVFTPKVQYQLKSQALYGKEMEKQFAEKEGHIIQSNNKNDYYGTISNPLQLRMKGRKCYKHIASFNNSTGVRKKVLKEATNI